jgi:primosomal protein N' (replication factor Y)
MIDNHSEEDLINNIYRVIFPGFNTPYLYQGPANFDNGIIDVGFMVEAPLRSRTALGWVIEKSCSRTEIPENTEPKELLSAERCFLPEQLPLFQWMADYYGVHLGDVIDCAIPTRPPALKKSPKTKKDSFKVPELIPTVARVQDLESSQQQAISKIKKAITENIFYPQLLFGVTGSGKTEVYLQAIAHALALNKTALLIVPEIALTPQLFDNIAARFQIPLGLLHSELSPRERWKIWQGMLSGEIKIAIGARSAVFAPLKDLGIIIVDEEHESSYKQSDNFRYHARDVAVMRAKLKNTPVVLGSATPSFETLLNASNKRYHFAEMPERVGNRKMPQITLLDLKLIKKKDRPSENISPQLFDAMKQALAEKEQIILLYNRRGFSSYLQCLSCSQVIMCSNCSVSLTFHKGSGKLLCHYCGYSCIAPNTCSSCFDNRSVRIEDKEKIPEDYGQLAHRGSGTERLLEEVQGLFPEARILRMDRDTVSKKDSYRSILTQMKSHEADILIGTQMIAKGHDIPGVTLVGIIDADVGLHVPDFRANERVFQLITQVSGRAGRGDKPGQVLVQTFYPEHPTLVAAVTGRFKAFARFELEYRKQLKYPPWSRLMRILIAGTERAPTLQTANKIKQFLTQKKTEIAGEFTILGPAPAPIERLKNRYRMHLLVKSPSAKILSYLARELLPLKKLSSGKNSVRIAIDIDPVELL